ncbi:uncharacterized protein K460DRAFT_270887 [Cucurbitaria berberidis CBS 394.84]|uniref:Uncharacterized protein n=1 Tax=Cucurbitaria berberidis CBS 394.84 TaxID=1168544 RepID=A0A9P4LDK3_9PLEO|nr:uncharacterized protein K460DRAFT_270887 [Cucurbitaria berberidis CBS 394.84]KAF1850189.1 hypothetical protein K460DRAFT_270887 [Cucurbitaria berberidis CBS 394.84]
MDPPATPGPRSSTTPAPATPRSRKRNLPPATPGRSITSPFPSRTPRTPGGTVTSCTSDNSLFALVTVHTAKCTECDQRNKDTMRRCPGCTFQVCKPCYERREKQGRGLLHGNLMSGGGGTPTTQRTVRKKPVATTPGGRSVKAEVEAKKEEVATKAEAEGEVKKVTERKEKAAPVPKLAASKKRAVRRKLMVLDFSSEESSDHDDTDFVSDSTSPTPSKRRRTALSFDGAASPASSSTTRATRKPLPTAAMPTNRTANLANTGAPLDPPGSTGSFRSSELNEDDILHLYGVKGYDEPLLGRRQPVMSNPVIEIPDIVKRNFKPRPTQEEIHKKLQENTLKHMEAQWKAEEEAYLYTVRAFVEREAAKHRDDVAMDEDENEALFSAVKEAGRKWSNHTYNKLDVATQNLVRRGLDMRLDRIDEKYKAELATLLSDCAARKLQELAQDSAPFAAPNPGRVAGSK